MKRKGRTSMDRVNQILEMHADGYSQSAISRTLKMCPRTVKKVIGRHSQNRLLVGSSTEIPPGSAASGAVNMEDIPEWLREIDWQTLVREVQKGVPVKVLFDEQQPLPVKYWSFWKALSRLARKNCEPETTIRLKHTPGEKTFVDYTDGIDLHDVATGRSVKTHLFVATLPFSSRVYAEFSFDQKLPSFIESHERMWIYFGGVTPYTVTDNLKSAVTRAHLYDPDINKTFVAYANHAGFAVLPARPRRPKDKANVECHAGVLQKTFFHQVRNRTFTSIANLNEALRDFLHDLNNQIMKDHGVSRNERFEVEKKSLQPVPLEKFEIPEVKEATVHPDCHIQVGRSFYSVPWRYVGQKVRVIKTFRKVCIHDLRTLEKIASHATASRNGERRTDELHWPPEKKEHCDFNIERALSEAQKIGEETLRLVSILFSLPHPLQYLRRVQGWIRLVSHGKVSRESMEYAAKMAIQHNRYNSSYVVSCAEFHESGGTLRSVPGTAPKRDAAYSFLQN